MSEDARKRALWKFKPGYKLTAEEITAFDFGWMSAMRFMAQPRIPAPLLPAPVCPNCGSNAQVFTTNPRTMPPELRCHRAGCGGLVPIQPKEHNPHGLVAFYTDAPGG